jgi:hypothetical protein
MLAIALLLLLHAPPDVAQYCGTDVPTIVLVAPVIVEGNGLTSIGNVL